MQTGIRDGGRAAGAWLDSADAVEPEALLQILETRLEHADRGDFVEVEFDTLIAEGRERRERQRAAA